MDEQFKMNMPDQFLEEADQLEKQRLKEQARLQAIQAQQAAAEQEQIEDAPPEPIDAPTEEPYQLKGEFDPRKDFSFYESQGMSRREWNKRQMGGGVDAEFTPRDAAAGVRGAQNVAAGSVDTVMDTTAFLIPWLKPADDWWEEVSGRKETTGYDKAIRDIGGFFVPFLGTRAAGMAGINALGSRLGMTGIKKGLPALLTNLGVTEAVGLGLSATNDNTKEAGNIATLIESVSDKLGFGIQVPWASRDSDSEDVIYKKNMFEEAALSGVTAIIDLAFSKYGIGRGLTQAATKLIPKDELSEVAIKFKPGVPNGTDPLDSIRFKEGVIEEAQTDEAVRRLNNIDFVSAQQGVEPAYDPFVNEPHLPVDRAMQDVQADPISFKAGTAKIQNNVGTVNGRARPAVTDHFKEDFLNAADGTERGEKLQEVAEGLAPSFDVVVGKQRIPAADVNKAIDNLVVTAFKEPENFAAEFGKLKRATDDIFGNPVEYLSEDGFQIATDAYKQFFDMLDPNHQRASAAIVTQTAGNVSDAARASELIGDTFRSTRQQELAFNALKVMLPEIRANQYISGYKLRLKNLVNERKTKGLPTDAKWFEEQRMDFDQKLENTKKEAQDFALEALKITEENPKFFAPLMREFIKSNGDVNSIDKLSRLAIDRISFWKKAFYNKEPEIPSLLVQQLQSARYNHVLTGMAPIRALTGAATGLIGKPVTALVGAAGRGNIDDLKRSMFVYGGVANNVKKAFKVMADEWKYALEAPDQAMARARKDYADTTLQDMETMNEMAQIWEENGELGKVAVWNMTRVLSSYNKHPIVRFGINAMGAIDGFSKSMSASFSANARAYDELFESSGGAIDETEFSKIAEDLYRKSFDSNGVLTDDIAQFASGEVNLNLDSKLVTAMEGLMRHVPVAKAIFMFPRTGINAINLAATFTPTGAFGQSIGRARKVLNAKTKLEIDAALTAHGYKAGNMQAFEALKSEYTGRQMMGSAVVMGAAMLAMEGNLTGSGPSNNAELRRMRSMGWEPFSIRNAVTGEWMSYQGLEPFDTFLGLVADVVFNGSRFDQAISEDWFRTLASAISLNVSQKTFLSGFEPLAKMISGDQGAISRFFAMQADSYIPGTGIRSILNKAIAPQLKDFELNFGNYLLNRLKFIPPVGNQLVNELDVYTGEPINYTEPINAAINAVLPFFKTNGKWEPWREKLLRSGWDNLQAVRMNPMTGEPLTPAERQWVNNYIGSNLKLGDQVKELFEKTDGWWDKKMSEYVKARGLKKQKDFPIKKTLMYKMLDDLHNEAFKQAFDAMTSQNTDIFTKSVLKDAVNEALSDGNMDAALKARDQILKMPK